MRVLVYGDSGTGKTTLASTFPAPILWLICSGGDKPGELRSVATPENRTRITPKIVGTLDQFYAAMGGALEGDVPDIRAVLDISRMACRYGTIVLDHATGFADMILSGILGRQVPAQKGWGLASQQQYGQQSLQFKDSVRKMLSLSCNAVIIAQQRTFGGKDDTGTTDDLVKPAVGAALSPSVAGWLNTACDYVVQTFKKPRMRDQTIELGGKTHTTQIRDKGVDYCLRTGPSDLYTTKFRIPRGVELPEYLVDPDYAKIIELFDGV